MIRQLTIRLSVRLIELALLGIATALVIAIGAGIIYLEDTVTLTR